MNTLIIGASPKPHRYAFQALQLLTDHQHNVLLFAKRGGQIEGHSVYSCLSQIDQVVHTVTLYVNPGILATLLEDIIALAPKRLIFNPGTESAVAIERLEALGIECAIDCTLIMLREGRY